jgi:Mg-chelatase subunit ChlD
MPFQFTHPGYLLLLPLLFAAAWRLGQHSLASLSPGRRRFADATRALLLLLLVFALAGFQVVHRRHAMSTVFVLDASSSVPAEQQKSSLEYIRQACAKMRPDDTAALVVFGADAYVEFPAVAAPKITRVYSAPSPDYTDLAAALRLAFASFSQSSNRQVVVFSDGNENLGSALDQAVIGKAGDIPIHTVALRTEQKSEVLLERATLPSEVKLGEPFEMKLVAVATAPASGRIRLFRNGLYVGEQPVSLLPGKSSISLPQSLEQPGFYTYEALLEAGPDTRTENNRAVAFVSAQGRPRLLLVAGNPTNQAPLVKALKVQNIDVTLQGLGGLPINLGEWRNWEAVAFADVPAVSLTPEQMLMVQDYVRSLGGGFAMIGGEEGFGAGGYFKTPIEETLPVDMAIRKQKVFPSLAVMLIMDTSGSSGMMLDGKEILRLEAESAIQVVETMQPIDQLGVIVSGEGVDVLAPVRYAKQISAIKRDISRMQAGGGGIFCRPSMERAYNLMAPVKARTKHIIMLADGSDCDEQDGCDRLAALMKSKKMTFSTVSFGEGPHTPFLARIAKLGGGKFYIARKARDLPRIFTKDAMLASKSLIIEGPFKPRVNPDAEILRGLDLDTLPPLLGYVATSPKSLADVPMETHQQDPLLATWRYGLGRSVAFTSDAQARWAAHWLGWPGYGKFWAQTLRWMLRRGSAANWQTRVEENHGLGTITVEAADEKSRFVNFLDLEATIVKPDLTVEKIKLEQTAPGRYRGEFPIREVGSYLTNVAKTGKGETLGKTAGLVIPYSPEYQDLKPNDYLLTQLAQTTGGRIEPAPENIFGKNRPAVSSPQDVWPLLLLLAALLWPVDIAARRLLIEKSQVISAAARVKIFLADLAGRVHPPAPAGTVGQLRQSQQARKARVEEQLKPQAAPRFDEDITGGDILTGPEEAPAAPQTKEETAPPAAEAGDLLARLKSAKRRARKE